VGYFSSFCGGEIQGISSAFVFRSLIYTSQIFIFQAVLLIHLHAHSMSEK
jgi:hypothetical protein